MKVKQISFTRLFNIGNYENESVTMTADLRDDEDETAAVQVLRQNVLDSYTKAVNLANETMNKVKAGKQPSLPTV